MFHNPEDCAEYGRHIEGPARARVFEISELLTFQRASREHCDGPTIRGWTYIILSCALYLNTCLLTLGDLRQTKTAEVSHKGTIIIHIRVYIMSLLFIYIGQRLILRRNIKNPKLCPVIALMTWLLVLR